MLSWLTRRRDERDQAAAVEASIRRLNQPPPIDLTVDVAVFVDAPDGWRVLLIERRDPPYQGCLALPGGYVEYGEDPAEAAARELAEETSLHVTPDQLVQVRTYGAPDRDPRGHVVSIAHRVVIPREQMLDAHPGDDAEKVSWSLVEPLLANPDHLAFDHALILDAAYYCR